MEKQALYSLLFDTACDAIMLLDKDTFFDCNKMTLEIFGFSSKEEFCTKHPADLSPEKQPDGKDSFIAANEKMKVALEKGNNRFDWIHKRIDNGKEFDAEVILKSIALDGRKFLQATVRDITGRKMLCEQFKKTAEREAFLRKITELIRGSFDINDIKKNIVNQVGEAFEADRCFIRLFIPDQDKFLPLDEHSEYLGSPDIKSAVDADPNKVTHDWIKDTIKLQKDIFVYDTDSFLKNNDKTFEKFKPLVKEYAIKSAYVFPIVYLNLCLGVLVINYTKSKHYLNSDDINFLKTIVDQGALVFYQAKLYEQLKLTAERETLLRSVITTVRETIDTRELKKKFVNAACMALNADRCFICDFDSITKTFFPMEYECLLCPYSESMIGVSPEEEFKEFCDVVRCGKNIIIHDMEKFIEENIFEGSNTSKNLRKYGIKTNIGIPIYHGDRLFGFFVFHYTKNQKVITDEDMEFLNIMSSQIGIALHHAELLEKTKKIAQREKFFSEVMTIIRSTLDIDEVISLVSKKIKEFYKAENIAIDLNSEEKIKLVQSLDNPVNEDDLMPLNCIGDNLTMAFKESELYTRSKYFSNLSHEMRTPLAIIDGYVNNLLIDEDFSEENVKKHLNIISKNTVRIIDIIDNMMTLSRLENKERGSEDFEKVNIKNVINNSILIQQNLIRKNIKFEIQCNEEITVNANSILLEQAILNLIKNAVQYSTDDSKVIINAEKNNGKAIISVQDFGIGIENKYLNVIFERFYRVDRSRNRAMGGSGLGLSIVKSIAQVHNGTVGVKSKPGKGSTFTIEIPCF